jgi:TnpA family transposase
MSRSVYINTDLIFGLFTLLGFRFAPRLRDLSDQTLYRARKGVDYGVLTPTLKKDIKVHLIMEHWDDLNRIAASLKDGLIRLLKVNYPSTPRLQ